MSKNEVVTQTDRGTLIQLDGTETDLQGKPVSDARLQESDKQPESTPPKGKPNKPKS